MQNNINNIIFNGGNLAPDEKVLILCSPSTKKIAELFQKAIKKTTPLVELIIVEGLSGHGKQVDESIGTVMLGVNLIFCLTEYSLAHSKARINANYQGVRFLSLPGYSMDLLSNPALSVKFEDFLPQVNQVGKKLTKASSIHIKSNNGTDLKLDVTGRIANCCTGFVDKEHLLGSPPDIEVNISPIEDKSEGVLIVNGSITTPQIELLQQDVRLRIKNGRITKITSDLYKDILETIFDTPKKRILAECGIGFNPNATLCGNMLIDEGTRGCIHFGFGSNSTVGGRNEVDFHLDFVCKNFDLYTNNDSIIQGGEIL